MYILSVLAIGSPIKFAYDGYNSAGIVGAIGGTIGGVIFGALSTFMTDARTRIGLPNHFTRDPPFIARDTSGCPGGGGGRDQRCLADHVRVGPHSGGNVRGHYGARLG